MKAQKDQITGKWFVQYRFTDYTGEKRKSTKRGFSTKREAEEWLRNFLLVKQADLNMKFADFVKIYYEDMGHRLRENSMRSKQYIINLKILPCFGNLQISEIKPANIRKWQNELLTHENNYSQTYLRTVNNQLTAIFNYAVRYYDLKSNPCSKAGSMGRNKADEMQFWTRQEFEKFIDSVMDKRISYIAFMVLYYSGCRIGELMALTAKDIDFDKKTISISKSYQRLAGRDVITEPKTIKSKRVISIPNFLVVDLQDYIGSLYGFKEEDRIFPVTKGYLTSEMKRGVKGSGVKKIRLHDIRHSHVALLVSLNFSLLEIGKRLGHSRIESTMVYAHLYPELQEKLADKLEEEYREGLR